MSGITLLGFSLLLCVFAILAHVVLWRLWPFLRSSVVLVLTILVSVLSLTFATAIAASAINSSVGTGSIAIAGMTALALSGCYVMSYPAIQAKSPTMEMTRLLVEAGDGGLTRQELYGRLVANSLVSDRIDDLVNDGLAVATGEYIVASRKGLILACLFAGWKAVLNEPAGG